MLSKLTKLVTGFPKTTIALLLVVSVLFAIQFPKIKIDTDPENMLEQNQPERVFYDKVKKEFGINDLLVAGIVDEKGIFSPDTLKRIAQATDEILKIKGVIIEDVVSLRTSDNVTSEDGTLTVKRFMDDVPQSPEEIERLRNDLFGNPFFVDKIISADAKATSIYIPIEKKDQSYRISKEIETILKKELLPEQKYYLAGLPVAEDTFGHEMFVQMGITAPLAGFFIMLLLFLIFRMGIAVVPPMLDAMLSVIWTMGLLIGLGFTVHIMSSMIPIFLMPIALLDDIHILSGFFERYPEIKDKRKTIIAVMKGLYRPMFFTSLTSAVGFSSLALADIPPVRIFGLFVAFGIMAAWLFTNTVVPAIIMLMNEEKLERFFEKRQKKTARFNRMLEAFGRFSFHRSRAILFISLLIFIAGIIGIYRIRINDNPVKWFKPKHRIRVADNVMNKFFGGTYMAYLTAEAEKEDEIKRPEVMAYLDKLQGHLEALKIVGKTSSVADIVKRINYVLHGEDKNFDAVPESRQEIGQYLFLFSMTGDPNDLDNFLDYNFQKANIWVQMKGGENADMRDVEQSLSGFMRDNPVPAGINIRWSGLTYINKVWQNLMVRGMLKAVLGSFWIVLLLMAIEFRSLWIGLISMLPLTLAIILSYSLVGFIGKDYDMPIAVCSALALGMAIDFAIHYLQRFKSAWQEFRDIEAVNRFMSGEPYRAIMGNAIVISLGFLPLITSTLTPYVTVGTFFALLMFFSTLATLILLPAIMRLWGRFLFKAPVLPGRGLNETN
ncbi:MAG: RND transporter [Candidatus Omnitrophica bacterium CG11_big_fil_rev_8_21_14_0_20_42_13]|uniref:RND transporter n=1 Tax=Candidatus Ghiorseimicrobium undicola TaxID=1974746 RepID=A0A2H0LZF7_9BACT|nr:MAG: RND transporter [Candidatus Omnitrophica bacterium CG11_big_fil_rev_8_21_14_0_20_42_13]